MENSNQAVNQSAMQSRRISADHRIFGPGES